MENTIYAKNDYFMVVRIHLCPPKKRVFLSKNTLFLPIFNSFLKCTPNVPQKNYSADDTVKDGFFPSFFPFHSSKSDRILSLKSKFGTYTFL